MRIFAGFPGERRQATVRWSKTANFSDFGGCIFGPSQIMPTLLYVTLNDIKWPFYVCNDGTFSIMIILDILRK